jgi:hypothetical protein
MRSLSTFGRIAASLAASAALLAGCGDDPDDAPAPPTASDTVPASATASSRAYAQFTASLPADERGTPLKLGDWQAPTSESDEPERVN